MKLKENFVLRQVVDTWVVLPLGATSLDFQGMLTLNESGAFLWDLLEKGKSKQALVDALTENYIVSQEEARGDVESFIQKLTTYGCVED